MTPTTTDTTPSSPAGTDRLQLPRFWPLFLAALIARVWIVLLGLGLVRPGMPGPDKDPAPVRIREEIQGGSAAAIEPWFRWDAVWYVNVGENGYAAAADKGGRLGPAFLPAMPACIASARVLGLNPFWTAIIVANLAAAAGTAVLGRVAAGMVGDRAVGWRAAALLTAYPAGFFLSAPYNEAFGLLFTALALAAWLYRRPVLAGTAAFCTSLARLTGVALGAAALGDWLLEDRTRSGLKRAAILAAGSFLGLIAFWVYLHFVVGDAFAGIKAQPRWGRKPLALENIWLSIQSIYDPQVPHWGEAAAVVLFLMLGVRAWAKRGAFWGLVVLVPIGQLALSGTLLSAHRLLLAALPAFIELADLLRSRAAFLAMLMGFAYLQVLLLQRFVNWVFAG